MVSSEVDQGKKTRYSRKQRHAENRDKSFIGTIEHRKEVSSYSNRSELGFAVIDSLDTGPNEQNFEPDYIVKKR